MRFCAKLEVHTRVGRVTIPFGWNKRRVFTKRQVGGCELDEISLVGNIPTRWTFVPPARELIQTYGLLPGSSLLALCALTAARLIFPVPAQLEAGGPATAQLGGFSRAYWLYMAAGTCFAAGLVSYELVSYHLASIGVLSQHMTPVFLAVGYGYWGGSQPRAG